MEKLDDTEYVSTRACIMFYCLLYGDYYIQLLSFRMKIADIKTSQGIRTWCKVISAVSQICKCRDADNISLCSEWWRGIRNGFREQQVNNRLKHLVLCLNKWWDELDVACRHTPFLWDKRWLRVVLQKTCKSIKDFSAYLHSETKISDPLVYSGSRRSH